LRRVGAGSGYRRTRVCSEPIIAASANLSLLSNAGHSAQFHAERRVVQDAARPAAGAALLTPAKRKEHVDLVAVLKAHGAT